MRWTCVALVAGLVACNGETDTDTDADTATDTGAETEAVITTVADDYSAGSLAVVGLEDWSIEDEIMPTSGDPVVVVDGDSVFQINRFGFDNIRVYTDSWSAPSLEISTGGGTNPQDVALCGGEMFVSLYEAAQLNAYDMGTGTLTGTVDLSGFVGTDGSTEASSLEVLDGTLYVGLNGLDRNNDWVDDGGSVLAVDCATKTVSQSWAAAGNTALHPWLSEEGRFLVTGRAFDGQPGGISAFDGAELSLVLSADTEGWNFTSVAAFGDQAVAIGVDSSWNSRLACIDLAAGAITWSESSDRYLTGVWANELGEAWVSARPGFSNPELPGGVMVFDIATCTEKTMDGWLELSLSPYSIAFR